MEVDDLSPKAERIGLGGIYLQNVSTSFVRNYRYGDPKWGNGLTFGSEVSHFSWRCLKLTLGRYNGSATFTAELFPVPSDTRQCRARISKRRRKLTIVDSNIRDFSRLTHQVPRYADSSCD